MTDTLTHQQDASRAASPLATSPSRAGEIRPVSSADIAAVAALYHRVFMKPGTPIPPALGRRLEDLFLAPDEGGVASLVYIKDGAIAGFVGATPLILSIDGRAARAAIISSFMVDRELNDPLGGAKLIRAMVAGPQDITISETASSTSLAMWRSLRGTVLPGYSLDWLKILSPARYLAAKIGRRFPLARLGQPAAGAFDRAVAGRRAGPLLWRPPSSVAAKGASHDVGIVDAAAIIRDCAASYRAYPIWPDDLLERRLAAASVKSKYGPMTCRAVTNAAKRPIGIFIYHAHRSGIGHVLQVLGQPGQTAAVLDQMFHHASGAGVAALTGRTDPILLDALLGRDCTFANYSSTVVAARDKSLIAPMVEGRALITGLAGESWSPLVGHDLGDD